MTFDILSFIGKASCDAASELTWSLAQGPACASDQIWNVGAVTVFIFIVLALGIFMGGRERRRHDHYLL